MNFLLFLATVIVAILGGFIGVRLKRPMGRFLGALMGVIALNLIFCHSYFYPDLILWMKVFSGAMIGSKIGRSELKTLRTLIFPTAILLVGLIALNLIFGGLVYRFSDLDLATSLFAVTPGGLTDITLMSADLGADPTYVGLLQIFRQFAIFLILVPLMQKILQRTRGGQEKAATNEVIQPDFHIVTFIQLILSAAAGGILFQTLSLSGGALTGAMLGSAAYSVATQPSAYPKICKEGLRIMGGIYIGVGITRASIQHLHELVIPMLIMLVGIVVFVLLIAFTMYKLTKLDLAICLLASTPGGLQEMSLLSEEFGADTPKVAVMHTARLLTIITFFPAMIQFIYHLWG